MNDALRSAVDKAREALSAGREGIDLGSPERPRYELFHAANSICSQKVRCVLAHHGRAYVNRSMNLFAGETYLPGYVRLRMIGCDRFGGSLASHHHGSTSTEKGGCDGAVAPTLVDWVAEEVIVDSKRICVYLDAQERDRDRLRPAGLEAAVDEHVAIVDNLPNYQLLMGRAPRVAERVESRQDTYATFSKRKVAWCDHYLRENAADETLARAYSAKRAKELSAANELFSPEAMRKAYDDAELALQNLEHRLARREGSWLFGERVTLADLFWGIELLRMKDVGAARFWEGEKLPHVERFSAATELLPAIRAAIIHWPRARF